MSNELTYKNAGVDYDPMDAFKRYAGYCALYTAGNASHLGVSSLSMSRGESAFITRGPHGFVGQVDEGLGTKNVVADDFAVAMRGLLSIAEQMPCPTTAPMFRNPHIGYRFAAQCTLAMIVNDMITGRIFPTSVMMHLSVGSSDWFRNRSRAEELVYGWMLACQDARCVWGGGETAVLKDIIYPDRCVLSGSALGVPIAGKGVAAEEIEDGDLIIFLDGNGIHANGLTLARAVADRVQGGYVAQLSDGRTYGEALLAPTPLYVRFVEACIRADVRIKYMVNITGHGWRKLMRLDLPFRYMVEAPEISPLFAFIQEKAGISDREMYGTFNMGPGFALIVHPEDADKVVGDLRHVLNRRAWVGGRVEKSTSKSVVIRNRYIEFSADELQIR